MLLVFSRAFHGVESHRGAVFHFRTNTVRFGAVIIFLRIVRCGAVRCGCHFVQKHTVRCSVAFLLNRCGAVRCGRYFSRIVRCGAVRLSVEQLFPTVRLSLHRNVKKRCTVGLNRSHTVQKTYGSRLPSKCQRDPVYTDVM